MFFERGYLSFGLIQQITSRPIPRVENHLVVSLFDVAVFSVFFNRFPYNTLVNFQRTKPSSHFVCCKAKHGVHAQTARYIVAFSQLSCSWYSRLQRLVTLKNHHSLPDKPPKEMRLWLRIFSVKWFLSECPRKWFAKAFLNTSSTCSSFKISPSTVIVADTWHPTANHAVRSTGTSPLHVSTSTVRRYQFRYVPSGSSKPEKQS